jgi:hypothetical protein
MLQRIQTLYLFGALFFNLGFLFSPIVSIEGTNNAPLQNVMASALIIIFSLLIFATIFFYKNRKRQMRVCLILCAGLAIEIGTVILHISNSQNCDNVGYSWGVLLPIISIVLLILAYRSINSDERLVRSADRLR